MDAKLNLTSNVLAFSDVNVTSNPSLRQIDWSRFHQVDVSNPKTDIFDLAPGETLTLFNGTRSTSINGSTDFDLTLSPLASTRYRFTWGGAGANPAFRTDRGLALDTETVTVVINNNYTATFTTTAGGFSGMVAGDIVFIPGTTTGDTAGPFSSDNEGYWNVLSIDGTNTTIQLSRSGDSFSGVSEVVILTDDSELQAFSSTGLQVGDKVNISSGFSTTVQGTYEVDTVNPKWFEVLSTDTLPVSETAVPTASGMIFYTSAKRYIKLEADQACVVRANGASDSTQAVEPWNSEAPGEYSKTGPTWSLSVENKSASTLNLVVLSAE